MHAVTAGKWQIWDTHFRHIALDSQVWVCRTGLTLAVSALLIIELIFVYSPRPTSQVSLALGLAPPAKAGLRSHGFSLSLAGCLLWGVWSSRLLIVFVQREDTELIVSAFLSHTSCQYFGFFFPLLLSKLPKCTLSLQVSLPFYSSISTE